MSQSQAVLCVAGWLVAVAVAVWMCVLGRVHSLTSCVVARPSYTDKSFHVNLISAHCLSAFSKARTASSKESGMGTVSVRFFKCGESEAV